MFGQSAVSPKFFLDCCSSSSEHMSSSSLANGEQEAPIEMRLPPYLRTLTVSIGEGEVERDQVHTRSLMGGFGWLNSAFA